MRKFLRAASLLLAATWSLARPAQAQRPASPTTARARKAGTVPARQAAPTAVAPAKLRGIWQGQTGIRRVILTLGRDSSTLLVPELSEEPARLGQLRLTGDSLVAIARYDKPELRGRFTEGGRALVATYLDYSRRLPVTLRPVAAVQPLRLAQAPVQPLPYRSEDVRYGTPGDSIQFGGTLTLPTGVSRAPAVVLLSGTGPQNRNGAFGPEGHQPFAVLADYLTRRGWAVLRVDDRGVGQTSGHYDAATTADFARDALVAVRYLRQRPDIDPARVGLVGHSEGGAAAIMAAADNPAGVAFVVSLAGLLSPGLTGLLFQNAELTRVAGLSARDKARYDEVNEKLFRTAYQYADSPELAARLQAAYAEWQSQDATRQPAPAPGQYDHFRFPIERYVNQATGPWYRYHLRFDPTSYLARVKAPVLALNGDQDLLVDYHGLDAAAATLRSSGNPDVTTRVLPGLNHLLQPCRTCLPAEYNDLDLTIDPAVLQLVGDWLGQHAHPTAPVKTGSR